MSIGDKELLTYCGLYCGLCGARTRVPREAAALRKSMHQAGYHLWATGIPGFKEFWAFLDETSDPKNACPGCRHDGGYPGCEIRKCARARGVSVCTECDRYPCQEVKDFAQSYPTLLADGAHMKEVGVDKWVAEQEERAETGFCYADVRIDRQQ